MDYDRLVAKMRDNEYFRIYVEKHYPVFYHDVMWVRQEKERLSTEARMILRKYSNKPE